MKKDLALLAAAFAVLLAARADAQPISRLSAEFLNFNGSETVSNTQACPGLSSCTTPALMVAGTGGKLVYSKFVFVPFASGPQTLYVTLSAIGDDHGGDSNFISCNVDAPSGFPNSPSQVCNPTPTSTGIDKAPPGWLTMAHHFAYHVSDYVSDGVDFTTPSPFSGGDGGGGTGDEHDNDYYYTWCKPISAGSTHLISLRMGNFSGPSNKLTTRTFVFFEKAFVYIDVSDTPPFGACTQARLPSPGRP